MALWIDDQLTRQREWYRMSGDACALLIELWVESKAADLDGALETDRLHRLADHFTVEARDELIANGWLHADGQGCDSELCLPIGIPGFSFLHNVAGRQESSVMASSRKKAQLVARRRASQKANHVKHHEKRGIHKAGCDWCEGVEIGEESDG